MANSSFNLADLNGSNGFIINGIAADDGSGFSVSNAGDINNDGIDDVIIGAGFASNGNFRTGQSYVVFGGTNVGSGGILNLSDLNGTNGFAINGIAENDELGWSVSNGGDINNDGIDDLIIGAPSFADPNSNEAAGHSYVVFGATNVGSGGSINVSDLNGTNGFAINGIAENNDLGISVSSAGDVNNDGIDDLIIGDNSASPNGNIFSGQTYVVFGAINVGSSGSLSLSDLNGTNGFLINGIAFYNELGWSVSKAGDVNNDGIDDLIIGAVGSDPSNNYAGQSYVVFGGMKVGSSGSLNLSSLDGTNGFLINGIARFDDSGWSVSNAGDVNNDGIDDLIIGARGADPNDKDLAGQSYVVFGRTSVGNGGILNLSDLNGTNGFAINGIAAEDQSGWSVSHAGDINADGIDDLIVGAVTAGPNGNSNAGESYVVFGGTNVGSNGILNLSDLNGTNGFVINGIAVGDFSGRSVSKAGDINGDGIDDLIIGASGASSNGNEGAGQSYVLYGNAAPKVDLNGAGAGINYAVTFSATPVAVVDSAKLTVADINTPTLKQATITITNLLNGTNESLNANITGTSISASYNAAIGILTLSGTDTLANYQKVLRTVTYNNTAATPNTTTRTIQF
ncbi:integrin alpha, partial [Nostoc sp. CHAB 5715]|uniref:beta strand repeat-containing protein n=1 Tax=Nostoc sp. CHAB 5715 TaxID=2780400 RepID=UPI001E48F630